MKKYILSLVGLILLMPILVMAEPQKGDIIKVYVFEAGGCPACEMQYEYLEGLDSIDEKFQIVRKELYVDHESWADGKDYDLGVKVADAFAQAGFKNSNSKPVAATSTPLVVVSDIYAQNGYNDDLETVINQAYEEGDYDAVSCIENGGTDCIRIPEPEPTNWVAIIILIIALLVVLAIVIFAKILMDRKAEKEEK